MPTFDYKEAESRPQIEYQPRRHAKAPRRTHREKKRSTLAGFAEGVDTKATKRSIRRETIVSLSLLFWGSLKTTGRRLRSAFSRGQKKKRGPVGKTRGEDSSKPKGDKNFPSRRQKSGGKGGGPKGGGPSKEGGRKGANAPRGQERRSSRRRQGGRKGPRGTQGAPSEPRKDPDPTHGKTDRGGRGRGHGSKRSRNRRSSPKDSAN